MLRRSTDPQYTHYIFNENQFNPAYTGSRELLSTN
ncbi:MAG: type IX secretion system membrane protein PorP/SprF [Bacteroidetes bacterium]|nr:type IX secretion system membrane protein PorP/SprF [Bacteroidota bacterium]